jgi:hypothetical protein
MKLDELLAQIDATALRKMIESDTVYESHMLKAAFNAVDIINMPAVELYRLHFALFHTLYHMQNEYAHTGKYLHVHFMRTGLFDYPPADKCAYFDDDKMSFCCAPVDDDSNHCTPHSEQLGDSALESISLKYFYLDKTNYDKLDSVTAENLLSGAWEVLSSENSMDDAYRTLGLHGFENIRTVKIRFREMCKKYHPDQGGCQDKFMDINRSYRMITSWLQQTASLNQ